MVQASEAAVTKLRVLVLSSRFPDNVRPNLGNIVEQQTLALAARPGVEVEVVAPLGVVPFPFSLRRAYRPLRDIPAEEIWKGLRVRRPRFANLPYTPYRAPAALGRQVTPLLRAIRRSFPFDVIAAQFFWPEGPAAAQAAKALGVPFSLKGRGHDVEQWAAQERSRQPLIAAAMAADGLLAVSGALRDTMIGLGLAPERIEVHYTGIDRDRFKPADRRAAKAALGIDGPLLFSPGNLMPRKGHLVVIEALLQLEGASLIIAGSGPEGARLHQRISELGLEGRVRMLGTTAHERMPALYAAADVTVLASSREGLANVWTESLACGTPVVTMAVGGARELIDRPAAGRIVDPDPSAIAAAVRELLRSPPDQASVIEAVARLSWPRNAEQLERHLRNLVEQAPAA